MVTSFLHIFSNKYLKYNILDLFTNRDDSEKDLSSKENIKDDMYPGFILIRGIYYVFTGEFLFSGTNERVKLL